MFTTRFEPAPGSRQEALNELNAKLIAQGKTPLTMEDVDRLMKRVNRHIFKRQMKTLGWMLLALGIVLAVNALVHIRAIDAAFTAWGWQ